MSNNVRGHGANSGGANSGNDRMAELRQIVEALFEERAIAAEIARLDQLVVADPACRKFYLESIDLHGNLYWDAAQAGAEPVPVATPIPERPSRRGGDSLESLIDAPLRADRRAATPDRARLGWIWASVAAVAVALIAALAVWPTMPSARRHRGPMWRMANRRRPSCPRPSSLRPLSLSLSPTNTRRGQTLPRSPATTCPRAASIPAKGELGKSAGR